MNNQAQGKRKQNCEQQQIDVPAKDGAELAAKVCVEPAVHEGVGDSGGHSDQVAHGEDEVDGVRCREGARAQLHQHREGGHRQPAEGVHDGDAGEDDHRAPVPPELSAS